MKKIFTMAFLALSIAGFIGCSTTSKTVENLKAAASGESNAALKYAVFSAHAKVDSLPRIAAMFAATSAAEVIHAVNHLAELGEMGIQFEPDVEKPTGDSTLANLYAAKNGEEYEFSTMYPLFIEEAQVDQAAGAIKSFDWAMKAEVKHADYYIAAIQALESGAGDSTLPDSWKVCPTCGDTYRGDAEVTVCQVCGVPADQFKLFQ